MSDVLPPHIPLREGWEWRRDVHLSEGWIAIHEVGVTCDAVIPQRTTEPLIECVDVSCAEPCGAPYEVVLAVMLANDPEAFEAALAQVRR